MRGKAADSGNSFTDFGITPAYAGKRTPCDELIKENKDHPCVCGEKIGTRKQGYAHIGSPLRMRGKASFCKWYFRYVRITPAYAGKSITDIDYKDICKDHPCVCGEKNSSKRIIGKYPGSPLRMRGKGSFTILSFVVIRITPAYAGKRQEHTLINITIWDHPCVCGEKEIDNPYIVAILGSPLRMRGKASSGSDPITSARITPAYAGKRRCICTCSFRGWDHPCVCGEKMYTWLVCKILQGSPLRMRGKVCQENNG